MDILKATNLEVQEYVPDVQCPNCGKFIRLPYETYAWYAGEVSCAECQCKAYVEIGDFEPSPLGGKIRPLARSLGQPAGDC